jgi:hypothetical protein
MRHPWLTAAALVVVALDPCALLAQQTQPAAPRPYKAVAIAPPKLVSDASLDAFRKDLADFAQRKDRAALARVMVFRGFFWEGEDDKGADAKKSAIDNLAAALRLDAPDGSGWEMLGSLAAAANAAPDPDRRRVVCAPAAPTFDDDAFEELVETTQTDADDWGYPTAPDVEVRADPAAGAPVIENLGLHLVHTPSSDAQAKADWIRVVTPSGKAGFAAATAIATLPSDRICYIKEATGWRIAGIIGGAGDQ